jgi:hypothetical protein
VDGRTNLWHVSAREAAALAEQKWVRLTANMASGIRSDIQIIPFGERYADERGAKMWQTIMGMLDAHEAV